MAAAWAEAMAALQARQPARALALCRDLLAADPDHAEALHLAALARWDLGEREAALASLQALSAAHPSRADLCRNLARMQQGLHGVAAALDSLRRVVALAPGPEARLALARALQAARLWPEAAAVAAAGLALAPQDPALLVCQAQGMAATGRPDTALALLRAAQRQAPDQAELLLGECVVLLGQGLPDQALAVADRLLALRPDDVAGRYNRGICLLLLGELHAGFEDYECRHEGLFDLPPEQPAGGSRLARGEPLAGLRLLLRAEQGLGDTLQFCRYAPLLAARGAALTIAAQSSLAGLLRDSLGLPVVVHGDPLPPQDRQAMMLSLPYLCSTTAATVPAGIPYLRADPARRQAWRQRLQAAAPGRRVGFVWCGNPRHAGDARRSIPLPRFLRLLRLPGLLPVSLVPQPRPGDAEILATVPALLDAGPALRDFQDTAALVAELDLVVTVDSAVAHLAGGLGRPCWVLLPAVPDWRWGLRGDTTPWYPASRLFRQPRPEDWSPVLQAVAAALASPPA